MNIPPAPVTAPAASARLLSRNPVPAATRRAVPKSLNLHNSTRRLRAKTNACAPLGDCIWRSQGGALPCHCSWRKAAEPESEWSDYPKRHPMQASPLRKLRHSEAQVSTSCLILRIMRLCVDSSCLASWLRGCWAGTPKLTNARGSTVGWVG